MTKEVTNRSEELKNNPFKNGENRYNNPETGKFVPGNPGGGRPEGKGISITTEIKRKLNTIPADQKSSYLELLVLKILRKGIIDGDTQIIKEIWSYIDGKPRQNIGLDGGEPGKPIENIDKIEIVYHDFSGK